MNSITRFTLECLVLLLLGFIIVILAPIPENELASFMLAALIVSIGNAIMRIIWRKRK